MSDSTAVARPLCGAKLRKQTRTCRQAAGARTDHPGQGRCWLHGGASPVKHGRYSQIQRPRISALIEAFAEDPDPLNLAPEVAALRAIVVDFIERWDETTEALLAWYQSWEARQRKLPADLEIALRGVVDEFEILLRERGEPSEAQAANLADARKFLALLETPANAGRPRQVLDLSDAARLIDYVGKMVERVEKIRVGSHISEHPEFKRITREMARHVLANVEDKAALQAIYQGWQTIPR